MRGGHAGADDHDADHPPVVALRVEGVTEREHDRGRDRGLNGRGGQRRRARHQPPQARRGRGRPPGQRPGAGPDPSLQGDDAREGQLILDGEIGIAGKGLDAALVGAQFVSGLFEQFAGTLVRRCGRAQRLRGRPQRRAVGRSPAASAFICAAAAARAPGAASALSATTTPASDTSASSTSKTARCRYSASLPSTPSPPRRPSKTSATVLTRARSRCSCQDARSRPCSTPAALAAARRQAAGTPAASGVDPAPGGTSTAPPARGRSRPRPRPRPRGIADTPAARSAAAAR